MGNLVKANAFALDLGKFSGTQENLSNVIWECRAGRAPPLAPAEFAARLETKSFTSKKADLAIVTGIYERAFEQRVGAAETLFYYGIGWGDAEAAALARALGAAAACRELFLIGNAIGDAGAAALAAALREGAAPKLERIGLYRNPASAAAVQALRGAREGLTVYRSH